MVEQEPTRKPQLGGSLTHTTYPIDQPDSSAADPCHRIWTHLTSWQTASPCPVACGWLFPSTLDTGWLCTSLSLSLCLLLVARVDCFIVCCVR